MKKHYYVYILASHSGTLYVGVTSNLMKRVYEHQKGLVEGFTKKYGCNRLVYFEDTGEALTAIEREKQLKRWNRAKKEWLIKTLNPDWRDLSEDLFG